MLQECLRDPQSRCRGRVSILQNTIRDDRIFPVVFFLFPQPDLAVQILDKVGGMYIPDFNWGLDLWSGSPLYDVQFNDFAGLVGNLEAVDALSAGDAAE